MQMETSLPLRRAVHLLATLDNIPALHCYPGIGYREMGECEEYGIRMKGFEKRLV